MRRFIIIAALTAMACNSQDDAAYTVYVTDAQGAVADAFVVLEVDDDGSREECGKTDSRGTAAITWDACSYDAFNCDPKVFAVRASKEGYRLKRYVVGFSQSPSASLELEACDSDCGSIDTECKE